MTSIDLNPPSPPHPTMPIAVQLLSTLLFGAFGILAIIFAFNASWVAGMIVALVLGWRGGFVPGQWQDHSRVPSVENLMSLTPEAGHRSSGNASFDAYRKETLERLEKEQTSFENFLTRLREARDKSEFDAFLDKRAQRLSEDRSVKLRKPDDWNRADSA